MRPIVVHLFKNTSPQNIVLIILISVQLYLFTAVNSRPILSQFPELTFYHLTWSTENGSNGLLKTGMGLSDLKKPFQAVNIDAGRLRLVSFFIDMLSFKFWQWLQIASFRSFTLIFLHLLNCILLAQLLLKLTRNYQTAILGGFLFLNSGIALSSLLLPFILAKFLATTFFLITWNFILNLDRPLIQENFYKVAAFWLLILLCLLSDETGMLLAALSLFLLITKDGLKNYLNRKTFGLLLVGLLGYIAVLKSIIYYVQIVDGHYVHGMLGFHLDQFKNFFKPGAVFFDTFRAFVFYFLKRNMGFWDGSFLGIVAILICGWWFFLMSKNKSSAYLKKIGWLLLFFILFKAILIPHSWGVHEHIMPMATQFPSLLFFSYYYPYVDTALWAIFVSLFLDESLKKGPSNFLWIFGALTIIAYSNVMHLEEAIQPVKKLMRNLMLPENIGHKILSIQDRLEETAASGPVYLAFPAGSQLLFKRNAFQHTGISAIDPQAVRAGLDLHFFDYDSLIPVIYLRAIEKGQAVISLGNVPRSNDSNELTQARFFLDVRSGEFFDLNLLRETKDMPTQSIPADQTKEIVIDCGLKEQLAFFIKGGSQITLKHRQKIRSWKQDLGQSYQRFAESDVSGEDVTLKLQSTIPNQPVELVGPVCY